MGQQKTENLGVPPSVYPHGGCRKGGVAISCGLKEHLVTPAHVHLPPAPPAPFKGVALHSRVGGGGPGTPRGHGCGGTQPWGTEPSAPRAWWSHLPTSVTPGGCAQAGAAPGVPSRTCRSGSSMLGDAALPAVTSRGVSPSFLPPPGPPLLTQTLQLGTATAADGTWPQGCGAGRG